MSRSRPGSRAPSRRRSSCRPIPGRSCRRLATEPLFESFTIADDLLKGRGWFFDQFTAADAHFFWAFRRAAQLDVDVSGFANCLAHFERMQTRPSVQKVLAYEKSVLAEFATAA
jgi:glutathione S-transferase